MIRGLPCPTCRGVASLVMDSRPGPNGWRRRRRCVACGTRFTTLETVQSGPPEPAEAPTVADMAARLEAIARELRAK